MEEVAKGQNNEDVMSLNRALIVQHLQRNGICTRAQLSHMTGLTQASISKIIGQLIKQGIVVETGYVAGEMGRRSIGISLNYDIGKVIGVRLSRRSFSIGVYDFRGEPSNSYTETFQSKMTIKEILANIKRELCNYLEKYDDIICIGIAVPGPYLEEESRILLMSEMKDWEAISLREEFNEITKVPVIIKHDANSGALAEWWFAPNRNRRIGNLIHFLVGEGVGAGIIENGQILLGAQGFAGEIGHISIDVNGPKCDCGNYGCLEMYCSSLAFVRRAREMLEDNKSSILHKAYSLKASTIFEAAKQGDELAIQLVKEAGKYIGYGVVTLINAYNPSTIVISNEMSLGGQLLLDEVIAVVNERIIEPIASKVSIELSTFQNDPILFGAAVVATDYCLKNPEILIRHLK